MDYNMAYDIHQTLKVAIKEDEDAELLYHDLVKLAVEYARMRTDWQLVDHDRRMSMDQSRTMIHDAFIGQCNALARYLDRVGKDVSWRKALTEDRKVIGDFACYLHAILGVEAR